MTIKIDFYAVLITLGLAFLTLAAAGACLEFIKLKERVEAAEEANAMMAEVLLGVLDSMAARGDEIAI